MDCAIAIVGMNGSGKSVFGKRLASKLHWKRADTDTLFEQHHGDHHAYIEKHGWEKFRKEEGRIVLDALRPETVVILSGGAIESSAVRTALKEHATVIWLQASPKRLHRHLQRAKVTRPEFKEGLHRGRVASLAEARNPHYAALADITIPASVPFAKQVPTAIIALQRYDVLPDPRR